MSKLSDVTLGDLIEFQRGYDLPRDQLIDGDYPVISSNGILGYHNEFKVKAPGVTIGRSGTVGYPQFIEKDFFPHNTSLFVRDFKGNNEKYIFYLIESLKLSSKKTGTGVPTMNRNDLHPLPVKAYLDSPTQARVASFLSVFDSKIQINKRIKLELESLAKTIYDYWFVQFDFPNEEGKPYKTSGGAMEWNDELKREIPKGWEVHRVGDLLETVLGGTPSTAVKEYWMNGYFNWLNSGEVAAFPVVESELRITQAAIKSSATDLLPKGTVLLSITRHLRPTILAIDACANQSVVGIKERGALKSFFLYPYLVNEIPRLMKLRTGAQQPHINKEIVDDSLIVIPPQSTELLSYYNTISSPIFEAIFSLAFQSKELAALRDFLLPLLMNGQVKVRTGSTASNGKPNRSRANAEDTAFQESSVVER